MIKKSILKSKISELEKMITEKALLHRTQQLSKTINVHTDPFIPTFVDIPQKPCSLQLLYPNQCEQCMKMVIDWTINNQKNLIIWITGQSGTGKSTIAKWILEQTKIRIQSNVPIRKFCGGTLLDVTTQIIQNKYMNIGESIEKILSSMQCIPNQNKTKHKWVLNLLDNVEEQNIGAVLAWSKKSFDAKCITCITTCCKVKDAITLEPNIMQLTKFFSINYSEEEASRIARLCHGNLNIIKNQNSTDGNLICIRDQILCGSAQVQDVYHDLELGSRWVHDTMYTTKYVFYGHQNTMSGNKEIEFCVNMSNLASWMDDLHSHINDSMYNVQGGTHSNMVTYSTIQNEMIDCSIKYCNYFLKLLRYS